MRSFVAALVLAVLWVSGVAAQPRTETLTGEIQADSPKLAGVLKFVCYEFDAQPGETVSMHLEANARRESWAGFYVLGLETCDPTGLGGMRAPWPRSKMMPVVDFSLKAEGGRYWIMVFSSIPGPHTLTIQHDAVAPKAVALKASARQATGLVQAAPLAQGPTAAAQAQIETISGELNAVSPVLTGTTRYGCHQIDTQAGETINVVMQPKGFAALLFVAGAEGCGDASVLAKTDYSVAPNLTFKSAGGSYWIMPAGLGAGAYALQIRRGVNAPTAQTLIKPLPVPRGTASTFAASGTGKPGQVIQDCPICPKMVVVPAGSFMMGSPSTEEGRSGDEGPRHPVTFARAFAIGAYEVTFDEWDACVADKQCAPATQDRGWGRGRRPVINVSRTDIERYLAWLSDKSGHKYFLPSESEWEYAARAGTDTPWSTGDALIGDDANILNNFKRSVPVGSFPPNAWGLYDVHGNALELVQDCSDVGYFGTPSNGAAAAAPPATCSAVLRGGYYESEPFKARSAYRMRMSPGPFTGGNITGFRVTRALD